MNDILKLIQDRQSTRAPFDPARKIPLEDLKLILEAGRWAPSAHNMQNFEILVVDDKILLKTIAEIKSPISEAFIKENYQLISLSEGELRNKKVGIMGNNFPLAMRKPGTKLDADSIEEFAASQERLIQASSALLIVLFDPTKRAPASEGDFLGHVSLGCMTENMWLTAQSLGIAFHIVSSLNAPPVEKELKMLLNIPKKLKVAFGVRLGYPTGPVKYLRVRRDTEDFIHHNSFENKGLV
jgi:nitroreductase